MKKFLTAFLFACALTLTTVAAVSCDDNKKPAGSDGDSASSEVVLGDPRSITFETGEGYSFTSNVKEGTLCEGEKLNFTVELGAFYTGSVTAYVNDVAVAPNKDGSYTCPVGSENLAVRVDGVRKDISNMAGSGTLDDAFVVTKPIDLVYIAQQVNAGNRAYATGSYVLANDIDCKGEELKIIGDYSSQNSIFSGSFACENNPETGEIVRHTISNFTINSENSNYVGLFGAVFADMSLQSSALFYGISIDNFTINAGVSQITDENKTVSCGGLLGYGVGVNLFLCDATNGEINITADGNYFSFVGGLIGYQQGFFDTNYQQSYPAEVNYAVVDVDINVLGGVVQSAGGITGYMTTNYPAGATASVHNSYSLGNINGALRSGGIVGGMGQYSSVSSCYATGEISARSYQSVDSPLIATTEYCYAYAGGIVGFAENDSIAHNSFFTGAVSAYAASGDDYALTSHAIAGGYEAGYLAANSEKYVALDCPETVDLSTVDNTKKQLGWQNHDWVFAANELPTINYESPTTTITLSITIKYVGEGVKVNGNTESTTKYFDTSIQSMSGYNHMGNFLGSSALPVYYEADNGHLSYGYFFDEQCTQRVPYSYLPMQNITLYVGFADPAPILGDYTMLAENGTESLTITFAADGMVTYSDGSTTLRAPYSYDGKTIVIEGARLSRYYQGDIVVDENDTTAINDPNFDLNRYGFYNYVGIPSDKGISFYDGVYFTAEDPLVCLKEAIVGEYFVKTATATAYYTFYGNKATVETLTNEDRYAYAEYDIVSVSGNQIALSHSTGDYEATTVDKSSLTAYDAFKGSWTKSANIHKTFTFDGIGGWEYTYTTYERTAYSCDESVVRKSGVYELVDGETLRFTMDGVTYTATFDADGRLTIDSGDGTQTYHAAYSYAGTWKGEGYTLTLQGIQKNGTGVAVHTDANGYETEYVYEVSETSGIIAVYSMNGNDKDFLFGYASYDVLSNTLTFTLPGESDSGYVTHSLLLYDDYQGEWICNLESLRNVEFHFDGQGLYSYLNQKGTLTLTENGVDTKVEYELDSSLSGRFSYKGVMYEMTYDELLETVTISLGANTSLERKDALADHDFVDMDGNVYVFDGKSNLVGGGTLTVGNEKYTYLPAENGSFTVYALGTETVVGSVEKQALCYALTLNGQPAIELFVSNEFMGDWAINTHYAIFRIGPTDLSGVIKATFKGYDVELTYVDASTLFFRYRENLMPYSYYVFVVYDELTEENVLVLSQYTNIAAGEYTICTRISDLFGTWEWNRDNGKTTLIFDGTHSGYTNGYAEMTLKLNHTSVSTEYFYTIKDNGIVMWSREVMAERTWYFRLDIVPDEELEAAAQEEDAYVLRDEDGNVIRALRKATVDGLYLAEAFDEDGVLYVFDGEGKMLVDGVAKYSYVVKSYNGDDTATLEVTDLATNITYQATLDYSDNTHYLFTVGEEIVEEEGIHN